MSPKINNVHASDNKVYFTYLGEIFCAKCCLRDPTCVIHKTGCGGEVYTSDSCQLPKLVTTTESQNVVTRRCNTSPPPSDTIFEQRRADSDVNLKRSANTSANSCAKLARV